MKVHNERIYYNMARPKSTNTETTEKKTTTAKTTETKTKVEKKVDENKEKDLQQKNDELMEIIKSMKAEIDNLKASAQTPVIIQQNGNNDLTRSVKVVSLANNSLVLTTLPNGKGNAFMFDKYGDERNIKFVELQSILQTPQSRMFEDNMVVLTNAKDYEDLGIGYLFDKNLSKEEMDELLTLEDDDCIDIILDMSDEMLDSTLRKIAENINNGVNYDYNKIKKLQDETDLKEYINLNE